MMVGGSWLMMVVGWLMMNGDDGWLMMMNDG